MRLPLCLLLAAAPATGLADEMPKLGQAEAAQLFQMAGFPLQGTTITNPCGKPAQPSVSFTDMNGDGQPEAVFIDAGPCYASGHWISILTRLGPTWVPVLASEGVGQPVNQQTGGWYDVQLSAGRQVVVAHYDGRRYVGPDGRPLHLRVTTALTAPAVPDAPDAPDAPEVPAAPAPVPGGEVTVVIGNAATPEQDALVRRVLAGEIAGAAGSGAGADAFRVAEADLNGDGAPELLVMFAGGDWCGSLGCANYIFIGRLGGGWSAQAVDSGVIFYEQVHVLPKMHRGMHDLRFDDSRHVFHWNGQHYN